MSATDDITRRKRPAQSGAPLLVRLQPDQLQALDDWIASSGRKLTRQEALRQLLAAVSAVPGGDSAADDPLEQIQLVDRGRSAAAAYARTKGRDREAEQIERGEADKSPLVQTMIWLALP